MRRKKAIKEFDKIREIIGCNVDEIRSIINSSDVLRNILTQLKITKGNKKIVKELTEINGNIENIIGELTTNTDDLYNTHRMLDVMLFHYPYFP